METDAGEDEIDPLGMSFFTRNQEHDTDDSMNVDAFMSGVYREVSEVTGAAAAAAGSMSVLGPRRAGGAPEPLGTTGSALKPRGGVDESDSSEEVEEEDWLCVWRCSLFAHDCI
jgi:hypothetical protein